jgi:prepilin-type N-terminal cleavage/methylation domain-containing protein
MAGTLYRRLVARLRAFALLEVMVAIVIIGVAVVALLRGFILAMDTVRRIRMNETAIMLARSVLDDILLEPPAEGDYEGDFASDPRWGEEFAGWHWELQVEPEDVDYDEMPDAKGLGDLEQIYKARLIVSYGDPAATSTRRRNRDRVAYIDMQTILMEPDVFSIESIARNQLF